MLYAATVQNLVTSTCNNQTGLVGSGAGTPGAAGVPGTTNGVFGGGITGLSTFCRSNTLNLPICNGLR